MENTIEGVFITETEASLVARIVRDRMAQITAYLDMANPRTRLADNDEHIAFFNELRDLLHAVTGEETQEIAP